MQFQKISTFQKGFEFPGEEGFFKTNKIMKLNWNFLRGTGGGLTSKIKIPSVEEIDLLWNCN